MRTSVQNGITYRSNFEHILGPDFLIDFRQVGRDFLELLIKLVSQIINRSIDIK